MITMFIVGFIANSGTIDVETLLKDTNGVYNVGVTIPLSISPTDTPQTIAAAVPSEIAAYFTANVGFQPDSIVWAFNPGLANNKMFSTPSRSLNTAYQPSTTLDTLGTYSVGISASLSLTSGQQGSVVLEYADDSGITTNVKTVSTCSGGNTGTLVIGLNTVGFSGCTVAGIIPTGKYERLRTVNTTGTPTFSSVNAQEVQF